MPTKKVVLQIYALTSCYIHLPVTEDLKVENVTCMLEVARLEFRRVFMSSQSGPVQGLTDSLLYTRPHVLNPADPSYGKTPNPACPESPCGKLLAEMLEAIVQGQVIGLEGRRNFSVKRCNLASLLPSVVLANKLNAWGMFVCLWLAGPPASLKTSHLDRISKRLEKDGMMSTAISSTRSI